MEVITSMIITIEMMIWLKKVVVVVVEVEMDTIKVVVVMDVVVEVTSQMGVITTAIVTITITIVMKITVGDLKKTSNKLNSLIVEVDKAILIPRSSIKNIMIMRAAAASQLLTHLKPLKMTTMATRTNKMVLSTKDTMTHSTDGFE
jgi:hypothetical protein